MEKQLMSNVDYYFLCRELQALVGARLDSAYDYPGGFRLKFRKQGEQFNLAVELGVRIHLTNSIPQSPPQPTSFTKLLRQMLENAAVKEVRQLNFDRVIEIGFTRGERVVFEQLGKGNVLLLDAEGRIVRPMRGEEFSSRKLRKGEQYAAPPSGKLHPTEADGGSLAGQAKPESSAVAFLSKHVNFAPFYLEEALCRAGYAQGALCSQVELKKILEQAALMLEQPLAPVVYFEGERAAAFAPFELKKFDGLAYEKKHVESFCHALEAYYSSSFVGMAVSRSVEKTSKERERLQAALAQQKQALAEAEREQVEAKLAGEWIYANYATVQQILMEAKEALEKKKDEKAVEEMLEKKFGFRVSLRKGVLALEV